MASPKLPKPLRYYLGNPKLKTAGVEIDFTPENVEEIIKCKDDPVYFAEKYVKIVTLDKGLVLIKLHPFQKEIIEQFYKTNRIIVKSSRQSGKTTALIVAFLHYIIFFKDKKLCCLAHNLPKAKDFLRVLKKAYENLPQWIQQGVVEWNKQSIELENGSGIMCAACGSTSVTGFTFNIIYLDEFAKVRESVVEDFMESVFPTLSSGTTGKVIITSTAQGFNHFYSFWTKAENKENGYHPINVDWRDIPGRDEEWKKNVLKDMNNNIRKFNQEYESMFLGPSNGLIESGMLDTSLTCAPVEEKENLRIFYPPVDGHHYVLGVDTSEGKGLDYSATIVFDITEIPYKIAAVYHTNKISHHDYPPIVANLAAAYNDALCLVENNSIGSEVANDLVREYDCCLLSPDEKHPGIRTTKKTKNVGAANLKDLIEHNKIEIKDVNIIHEVSNFGRKNGSWEALSGHDDLVMCLVLFAWGIDSPLFAMATDIDMRDAYKPKDDTSLPFVLNLNLPENSEDIDTTTSFGRSLQMQQMVQTHGSEFMQWMLGGFKNT